MSTGFYEAFGYCPAESSDGGPEGWHFRYRCTLDAHPPGTRHEAHGASPLAVWYDGGPLEFDLSHECRDCGNVSDR